MSETKLILEAAIADIRNASDGTRYGCTAAHGAAIRKHLVAAERRLAELKRGLGGCSRIDLAAESAIAEKLVADLELEAARRDVVKAAKVIVGEWKAAGWVDLRWSSMDALEDAADKLEELEKGKA